MPLTCHPRLLALRQHRAQCHITPRRHRAHPPRRVTRWCCGKFFYRNLPHATHLPSSSFSPTPTPQPMPHHTAPRSCLWPHIHHDVSPDDAMCTVDSCTANLKILCKLSFLAFRNLSDINFQWPWFWYGWRKKHRGYYQWSWLGQHDGGLWWRSCIVVKYASFIIRFMDLNCWGILCHMLYNLHLDSWV
jgi:hypothetical protein